MSETFQIHTHKAKVPKKSVVSTKRKKKEVILDENGDAILPPVLTQKFTITSGEKSCIVKMGNMSFGIKLGDMGIESIMRNCDKDVDILRNIISIMRTMKKANISFEAIAARLTVANETYLPQSVKQFQSALAKPIAAKPVEVAMNDDTALNVARDVTLMSAKNAIRRLKLFNTLG
jgi:hypothetical protein